MIESMIGINIIIKLFLNDTLTNLKVVSEKITTVKPNKKIIILDFE